MIIEIRIPDEIFEQYNLDRTRLEKQLIATVGVDMDPALVPFHFDKAQIAELRRHFGPNIKDADALITLIKRVGSVRLQKAAFQYDSDQIEATVEQAYFYADTNEPRDRSDDSYSKAAHGKVVQRHVQLVLNDALNYVLGLG